jgi:hypothetical protein
MSGFNGVVANRVVIASSAVKISITGQTTEYVFATIPIPPLQPNSIISITTQFSCNNNAGVAKNAIVRFSGAAGTKFVDQNMQAGINMRLQNYIHNRGATNSQVGAPNVAVSFALTSAALITSSVDTTVATSIVLAGLLALGTDTISLESYLIEVINP